MIIFVEFRGKETRWCATTARSLAVSTASYTTNNSWRRHTRAKHENIFHDGLKPRVVEAVVAGPLPPSGLVVGPVPPLPGLVTTTGPVLGPVPPPPGLVTPTGMVVCPAPPLPGLMTLTGPEATRTGTRRKRGHTNPNRNAKVTWRSMGGTQHNCLSATTTPSRWL